MTEIYSLSSNFGGNLDESQLKTAILAETGITTTLLYLGRTGDNVSIVFATQISAGEKTLLDVIVAAHVPIPDYKHRFPITIKNTVKCSNYYKIGEFIFPGGTYAKIKITSYMESSVTSYDTRIYDYTNKNVLAEANFTNTTEQSNNIGILSNISSSEATVEIHIRKNGGTSNNIVYCNSLLLEYI